MTEIAPIFFYRLTKNQVEILKALREGKELISKQITRSKAAGMRSSVLRLLKNEAIYIDISDGKFKITDLGNQLFERDNRIAIRNKTLHSSFKEKIMVSAQISTRAHQKLKALQKQGKTRDAVIEDLILNADFIV